MSVPESTSSKGRPSLLSETAPGAADNSSRILASLEGRVVAQPVVRRRSKKPLVAAALAVMGLGALAAWQLQRGQNDAPMTASGSAVQGSGVVAGAGKAQAAASASVVATAATAATAASAPQAAVIVADDSVRTDTSAASASSANTADTANTEGDRLERALASGTAAQPAASPTAVAAAPATSAAVARHAPAKAAASHTARETRKNRHTEKMAAAHAGKRAKSRAKAKEDDPDADLLAALVARTKPYEPKASKANAPKAAHAGARTAQSSRPAADAHRTASLADRIKACDKGNFFEAQTCRWHVCSDHWGEDPACPSTASATQTR